MVMKHLYNSRLKGPGIKALTFTKINSKWIMDINVKLKTIKLLELNTGEDLLDLEPG